MKTFKPPLRFNPEVLQYFRKVFGERKASSVLNALYRPSKKTCLRVNTLRKTPEAVADELAKLLSVKVEVEPRVPGVVLINGFGPEDVKYDLEDVKELIVDRKAGEAILRGADVFTPGVLASSPHLAKGDKVYVSVALERPGSDWCGITRGTTFEKDEDLPEDVVDRGNLYLGIGESMVSRTELFRKKEGVAVKMTNSVFQTPSCSGVMVGDVMLQNLPSVVAAAVMEPKPGWRVLDMCAAPGGKTTALAQFMQNQGEVIALDRTHKKVGQVLEYAEELGLTCVKAYKMDACKAATVVDKEEVKSQPPNPKIEARLKRKAEARVRLNQPPVKEPRKIEKGRGFEHNSFDGVLLDAPCTALGLRPRLLHRQTMEELANTEQYQRNLIDAAVHLVKPGGFMLYSTCTINPGENERNVRYVLDEYPFMRLVQQSPRIGGPGLKGPAEPLGDVPACERWLSQEESDMVQRFDPSGDQDTIGFFIAKFQKQVDEVRQGAGGQEELVGKGRLGEEETRIDKKGRKRGGSTGALEIREGALKKGRVQKES
ncbi:hypothetical protein BSKO_00567 [Bryopsis sp. KO-2023]|nr:hypothetical protein BSKO_00567 [Bryopsis sp. KO-2023]